MAASKMTSFVHKNDVALSMEERKAKTDQLRMQPPVGPHQAA